MTISAELLKIKRKKEIIHGFTFIEIVYRGSSSVYVRDLVPCVSRISSKIISRRPGTHYVNEAVVKATSRLFFRARTPAADVSRPSGHLPPPARSTSRSGTFLPRMRSTKYPQPWLDFCRPAISFRSCLHRINDAICVHAKLPYVLVSKDFNRFVHFDLFEMT